MHVADFSRGIIGANGIVAGGIGLAAGAALAAQLDGQGAVSVAFFGDGAANHGVLMEALNVSALWKLPLILVCENNGFSEFSPTGSVTVGEIVERARPFGVPAMAVDGNDVLEVWHAAAVAILRARHGEGPSLIECRTYRIRGHVESEVTFLQGRYRTDNEVATWMVRDPIARLRSCLTAQHKLTAEELETVETDVAQTVAEAVAFAERSAWPEPLQARDFMFG
jgi:pyruvate dehydrogenase E1 component alpha subunit